MNSHFQEDFLAGSWEKPSGKEFEDWTSRRRQALDRLWAADD
ncbi:hypothetical protein NP493_73g04001 [Ridgeia piscesae]|uniref:Uncharacterized protein n=1 Tax=Ridgeia piscesae TaxID=27915 RepID=A0AAD9P9Y9_RIDPI|nr:hypothetical protein NP493_73g04001 [Ridgeia piscesae]